MKTRKLLYTCLATMLLFLTVSVNGQNAPFQILGYGGIEVMTTSAQVQVSVESDNDTIRLGYELFDYGDTAELNPLAGILKRAVLDDKITLLTMENLDKNRHYRGRIIAQTIDGSVSHSVPIEFQTQTATNVGDVTTAAYTATYDISGRQLLVSSNVTGIINVKVGNLLGQEMVSTDVDAPAKVDLSNIGAKGYYVATLTYEGKRKSIKFYVQ